MTSQGRNAAVTQSRGSVERAAAPTRLAADVAGPAPARGTPGIIRGLQRDAGNQATSALIQHLRTATERVPSDKRLAPPAPASQRLAFSRAPTAVLQRCGSHPCSPGGCDLRGQASGSERPREDGGTATGSALSRSPLHEDPGVPQLKLVIGSTRDPLENDADRLADTVMRASPQVPRGAPCECAGEGESTGECGCHAKPEVAMGANRVARSATGGAPTAVPAAVHSVLRTPGRPLGSGDRAFMEPRFGHEFGDVRIHDDVNAAASAAAVNARAYTVGRHVVFGVGQYMPGSDSGRWLLAHELAHVVQQAGGEPVLMRAALPFASTMKICRWLLESRHFDVNQGAISVTAHANWEPSEEWQGAERPECGAPEYHITLSKSRWIRDADYGSCLLPTGKPVTKLWNQLPDGEYYLTIWTNNTNPNCCLEGDIVVEQVSGITGDTCTQLPPGPLEMLHEALSIAGLIPALGAVPDLINAGIYLVEGDWVNAGFSAAVAVPFLGDAFQVARRGSKFVLKVAGKDVERLGTKEIGRAFEEAKGVRRTAAAASEEAAEKSGVGAAEKSGTEAAEKSGKAGKGELPKGRIPVPGLPGCRMGSLFCPLEFLKEEFKGLFEARRDAEFAAYLRHEFDMDLYMGRSLRREQTILTGNRMYAQFMSEVPPSRWSEPFREAVYSGRAREIAVGGRRFRWPLDDLEGPWVVHHDPPLGWVTAESSELWHPMPYREHDSAHKWWSRFEKMVKGRIPKGEREHILEGGGNILDFLPSRAACWHAWRMEG